MSSGSLTEAPMYSSLSKNRVSFSPNSLTVFEWNLEVKSGCQNLEVESVGQNLEVESGGQNLEVESVGQNLEVESVGPNLEVESVGQNLEVESVGQNVEVESEDQNLEVVPVDRTPVWRRWIAMEVGLELRSKWSVSLWENTGGNSNKLDKKEPGIIQILWNIKYEGRRHSKTNNLGVLKSINVSHIKKRTGQKEEERQE